MYRINEPAEVDIFDGLNSNASSKILAAHANHLMASSHRRAVYMVSPWGLWAYPLPWRIRDPYTL